MYFRVRNMTGPTGQNEVIIKISKMAKIEELKNLVYQKLDVETSKQVLLYKGKQLVEEHKVLDYDIQLNDVVQLLVKSNTLKDEQENMSRKDNNKENEQSENIPDTSDNNENKRELVEAVSKYYKIKDLVDVRDTEFGAWFEAKIIDICKEVNCSEDDETSLIFKVQMERGEVIDTREYKFDDIRPRAYHTYKKSELAPKMRVMACYNIEEPTSRGFWYDFEIEEIADKSLIGRVLFGQDQESIADCVVKFADETMRIESPILLDEQKTMRNEKQIPLRKQAYKCKKCKDLPSRKCKHCGCSVCGGKENPDNIIMCDECDSGFHLQCLLPPLEQVPLDPEWYCPDCKNDENEIVKAGDKLKFSSKKAKMASNKETSRDWGSGMACVGRTTECTIVPKDHYGPVPGVEVGTCWKFRLQVSEAGIHRPHVAGIHGRETDGAYSLVLSGGYEDDVDNGEEFYYTGSGGRDLSGNKRVNDQSSDQKLTRMNKALALNCNAKFNDKIGAVAKDWRGGKPVRVVRNYKLAKHSKYAPKDGNRYDGIYKVVKYYPEKGKSGFIVWRYFLRRDDPTPAPWAKGGQELEMIYPPGYLEAQQEEKNKKEKANVSFSSPKSIKRKVTDYFDEAIKKKPKMQSYTIHSDILKEINGDNGNEKLWKECQAIVKEGKQKFLNKVEETFMCICCQEIVYQPITTECGHNICKSCLKRSFKSEIYTCPCCRFDLTKDYEMKVNKQLSNALHLLFPGYEAGR